MKGQKRTFWGHVNVLYVDLDRWFHRYMLYKINLEVYLRFVHFRVYELHLVKEIFKIKRWKYPNAYKKLKGRTSNKNNWEKIKFITLYSFIVKRK